jgi:hypothetical protein
MAEAAEAEMGAAGEEVETVAEAAYYTRDRHYY